MDSCEIDTPRVTVRDDVAPAVSLGPVYLITGTSRIVDLEHPLQKVLILVDDSAGSFVRLHGQRIGDRIPLLFYYRLDAQLGIFDGTSNLKQDALGVDELDLTGPFHLPIDVGRGYFLATHPGCYDVTAEWEGGTATRQFYFYLDASP